MTCNNDCFNCIYPDCIASGLSQGQEAKEKLRLQKYYQSHAEQCKAAVQAWKKNNPQKVREYQLKNGRTEKRKKYLREYYSMRKQEAKNE